ncbi:MAG: NAD+ synthase [Planctomycetes bacterium]|nr:NAD+ synthase [Planctomycetota bacterium]
MRLCLAQLNPTVGDIAGNTRRLLDAMDRARADGAEILVGAEMGILGYPPRDLLLRERVVEACEEAVRVVASSAGSLTVIVGHPRRCADGVRGVRNSASVCRDGEIVAVYDKRLLPGYDIFDEDRYFDGGDASCVVDLPGGRVGLLVCEDLWRAGDVTADPHYDAEPLRDLAQRGCDLVVALNASPFVLGKCRRHLVQVCEAARRHGLPIVAVNQVGAHDDLVFDGRSMFVGADGVPRVVLPGFETAVKVVDLDASAETAGFQAPSDLHDLYHALVLGVRDYCAKTRHADVLIGLSGGIDSALTATIAAAALGPAHVHGVIMPSRYSSPESIEDARGLEERLGLPACERLDIESAHGSMRGTLGEVEGVTDENLQARIRGVLLMARSNASGALLLATSNKSELAMGYSTLYGDMCGAVAVIGDVLKTQVYALARWINDHPADAGFDRAPIPERSITKPPSAELRPNQTDQDSLPPYEVLDAIVERHVQLEHAADRIIAETEHDPALVEDIVRRIDRAEYKRFQSAIIPKVTQRAFGRGRPMPLVMNQTDAPEKSPTIESLTTRDAN